MTRLPPFARLTPAPGPLARTGVLLSAAGYGLLTALVVAGFSSGLWPIPGGDVANFIQAGERLRAGGPVYVGAWDAIGTVYYAPPLIVVFAGASFMPGWVLWAVGVALDVVGLRYIAGSWTRVGWLALCPITVFQLVSGNPNFGVVAAILLAHRQHAGPLAWAALAKLGPAVAMPPRRWRQAAAGLLSGVIITIPWLYLWPEWVRFLGAAPSDAGWPTIIPLVWRLPIVVALLLTRRTSGAMLAGALAIPGFYIVTAWATLVLMWRLGLDAFGSRGNPT